MKAYGITYEDFRTMAKYVSPDAVDYTDFNFSSDKSIQIMYPVDQFKLVRMDLIEIARIYGMKLSDKAFYTDDKSNTYYTVIIDTEE